MPDDLSGRETYCLPDDEHEARLLICVLLGYLTLHADVLQSSEVLSSSWVCTLSPGFASIDHKVSHDHERVLADFKKILASRKSCPSKKQLAATLGISTGYLEYRFPAPTAESIAKHGELVEQSRLERNLKARHAALDYFVSPIYADLPKSRKHAYKVLRDETGLPKFMLKDAISGVYQAIN